MGTVFAEQNYSNIVSINFVLEPKYKTISQGKKEHGITLEEV